MGEPAAYGPGDSRAAGVAPLYILVANPPLPQSEEGSFPVLIDGETKTLRDVSPLVGILEQVNRANWRFGIYCREEDRERVAQEAIKSCCTWNSSYIDCT